MKLSIKNNDNVSRNTQEAALVRALQFLRAIGSDPNIMEQLRTTGFDEGAQKQGWALVLTAYSANAPVIASMTDGPLNEAVTKVDDWQSSMFVRAHAVLRRFNPEQDAFVFENLVPGTGIAAVASVATFLDRLDALETGAERKATRKTDHAALAATEQRGITKEQRKEMRAREVDRVDARAADGDADVTARGRAPRGLRLGARLDRLRAHGDLAT
ncbi:MAG TPA: hypothetical protein VGH87_27725 [Polyangiaceae bacterium]|jgi:hypothetical protein